MLTILLNLLKLLKLLVMTAVLVLVLMFDAELPEQNERWRLPIRACQESPWVNQRSVMYIR